jgi:hypothetical protein
MELTLVVPGLLAAAPERLARERALSRIAGACEPLVVDDLDFALLRTLDLVVPVAPLAALGAGMDPAGRYVIRADPVTMRVTHDDVRIAARVDDLSAREAETLVTLLDAHFAVEGLSFLAPRRDAWFAASHAAHEIATTPLDAAVGQRLRPCLPTGADATRWRRWLTEAQMLLHGHALAARDPPVNGLWFSGGGMLAAPDPRTATGTSGTALRPLRLQAAPGREGDVARGIARLQGQEAPACTSVADALVGPSGVARVAIVLPRLAAGDIDAAIAPITQALAALDRGAVERFDLVADGRGVAATWSMGRAPWWQRIAPRTARFVAPERTE